LSMDDRLTLGWRGFDQAERQLLNEIQKNGDPLVSLGNLLQWAYAIDQWHKQRIVDGEKEILRLFGADMVGETYNGFRAARSRVAHDLSLVGELVVRPVAQVVQARGAGPMIIMPPVISEWLWNQNPGISPNDKGLPSYQKHLARKPIHACLAVVREFLGISLPGLLSQQPNPP
jgi:hypothetical protein